MIVLRRSLYGVVSDGRVLGLFVPLPPAVLTRFPQGANISLAASFGRIVFSKVLCLSCFTHATKASCFLFHLPSGRRDFKGFPLTLCFLVLRAGSSPGPYTQCGITVSSEKAAVRWRCFAGRSALLPMRRALSPRKSLRFSFMFPYSRVMMIVDISLHCVGSLRSLWGTLLRLPRPLSFMFPYSRRVMIVLRRSLYGVVSDGCVLGLFVPCRQQF